MSIAILITAAALMQLISGLQQGYSRKQTKNSLEQNAEMELFIKGLNIKNALASVELVVQNHEWEVEQLLPYPDSLFAITRRIVLQNPNLDGCCIGMLPDYYPEKGRLFEPYTLLRDGQIETVQLGSEQHDYSTRDIFLLSVARDTCCWSEPYPDPYDPNITLITYTFPIHDNTGKVVGVMGVDLLADWLGKVLNSKQMFPSSYTLLISGEGRLICGPESTNIHHQEVEEMLEMINDSTLERSSSASGRNHLLTFIDKEDGSKGYVYYSVPKELAPWNIAVVNYDEEVFRPLRQMRWLNLLLTLVGLLIFAYIIRRSAKTILRLQEANLERERIDNELNIARKIQMDLLPKTFPPFPERNDLDIFGSLVPAKIVGGDLYDFFIRDEKLFFCIGDVSGKGVPAALVMAMTHSLFRNISAHESNPSRIMQAINESSCQNNESNMFVTFFIGVLDLPTGKLRYCNAGHDQPVILGQEIRTLPAKAHLPLGVMDDIVYTTQEDVLQPNELIFLFTDGLTEAKNEIRELFGMPRLYSTVSSIKASESIHAEQFIRHFVEQVNAFVQEAEQSDDLTMLAIRYTPQPKHLVLSRSLVINNKVSEITRLNAFVKSATTELQIEKELANRLKLAVEEAVTNCVEYAYPPDVEGNIEIVIEADEKQIHFIVTDTGVEFDPTKVSKADTNLSIDERPIGGLGILLVRNLVDSINYERSDGHNVLRIQKRYHD